MVQPSDLDGLPGYPFTEAEVDAAVATLQREFGWHVAPKLTTTLTMSVPSGVYKLRLPTKKLVSVTSITVDGTVVDASDYTVVTARNQVVKNVGYWTVGDANTVVVFKHGYDETPKDLLPLIAEAAAIDRRDESVKPYRLSFAQYQFDVPRRYSINYIPGMA